jgi:hypothetical protein
MAASGASSSFEWHGGGVELGAAEETRAHGGGAGMRPPGMWSFGVVGINTTADAGTSASGGVRSSGGMTAAWGWAQTNKCARTAVASSCHR